MFSLNSVDTTTDIQKLVCIINTICVSGYRKKMFGKVLGNLHIRQSESKYACKITNMVVLEDAIE